MGFDSVSKLKDGKFNQYARIFCLPALFVLLQTSSMAEPVGNIAVKDFKANNASASEAAAISEFVRSAFVKSGKYNVVDKANMEKILAEQAFQQTGCTDQACAVKLGKMPFNWVENRSGAGLYGVEN